MGKVSIEKLLNIGIAMSKEKNGDKLLETILKEAMDITDCDGGTLYTNNDGYLHFKIMITKSFDIYKGMNGDKIELPPVEINYKNVCARAVVDRELKNIADVYSNDLFDFSGPRRYDSMTGYHTQSMMVVPMENDQGEIIGVLQLINSMNSRGEIVPFEKEQEVIVLSLASQAAICMTNMNYSRELIETLDSFVKVMSTAIDARTPYNANHTRNMVKYCSRFIDWLENNTNNWNYTESEKRQLLMSIWLHDVGKLVIPLEVMDKKKRLGDKLKDVEYRFREIHLVNELEYAKRVINRDEYFRTYKEINEGISFIEKINSAGFITDEEQVKIRELAARTYTCDGIEEYWLTEEEKKCLLVKRGTLTDEERYIMETHVVMTTKMLSEMNFPNDCKMVPIWASMHHETLDGKGYPEGLKGDELCREARLITILDIFDALTAIDRPYKPPMTVEAAIKILNSMADEGKLDLNILNMFTQSKAWENDAKKGE